MSIDFSGLVLVFAIALLIGILFFLKFNLNGASMEDYLKRQFKSIVFLFSIDELK